MIALRNPNRWLIFSLLTIIVSVIIIASLGVVWGIDFAGGSLMEISAPSEAIPEIDTYFQTELELPVTLQQTSEGTVIIRTEHIDEAQHREILNGLAERELIEGEERRFETIGPTVGQELRRKSLVAVGSVVLVLIGYLAYTFRTIRGFGKPWQFGVAAAYALLHDLILVTALFAIFGKVWQAPIDTLFVTAQLAILGYSVNDTIVIFQRAKEEWIKGGSSRLDIINLAMKKSIARSLNTSLTTLAVLFSLLFFGGATIRWFIVALAAGTITGTYSSLFVAPPLLYYLARRSDA